MIKNWNKSWNKRIFLSILNNNPNCNIALQLGSIVDVEGDTEEANEYLDFLTAGYPHPTYRSNKSIHHLFLSPDKDLTRLVCNLNKTNDIEFRAKNHMSILPPSTHSSGVKYQWVNKIFELSEMPSKLKDFYNKNKKYKYSCNHKSSLSLLEQKENKWTKFNYDVKPGHKKLICPACNKIYFLHKKRYLKELSVFNSLHTIWKCKNCRVVDIRELCRKL